jgi:TRAP-type mannitol/chloroaromatic compound transport system substrate-binding protein
MLNRRVLLSLVASAGVLVAGGIALAKNQHHNNGHNLLGAKLNQNGKHEIGKAGNATVTAEVSNKKVVNMSAGSLPMRKVKSKKKMAGLDLGSIQVVANGEIQLAQTVEVYYYGYCFDAGLDEYCYWYPAVDVIVTDTWIEYTPV